MLKLINKEGRKMKEIIEANKQAWNEAVEYHKRARKNSLHEQFKDTSFTTFNNSQADKNLIEKIKGLNLKGKKVAHLQTNNGRELISLMRVCEAKEGIGFDISDQAIAEANELKDIAKANAKFECVNIFEIDKKYNNYFDMVYVTEGSLSWLPSVEEYFSVVSRITKRGGSLLISEIHPIGFVLDKQNEKPVNYQDKGPYKLLSGLDYVGEVDYQPKDCFWYMHKTSDIIMGLIKNGFEIKEFEESNEDTGWVDPKNENPNFPRSFVLIATKR